MTSSLSGRSHQRRSYSTSLCWTARQRAIICTTSRLARLGTLPRLTGGRPVVCIGVFLCFYECAHRRARIRACTAARYAHLRWGSPARTKLAARGGTVRGLHPAATPSPLHCSSSVRRQGHRRLRFKLERTGITYVYFYTTFDERTTKRRAGSPAARQLKLI